MLTLRDHAVLFQETYLYKLHSLTTQLDRLFDRTLQQYAGMSLSQFLLLMAISQHNEINQRQVAKYLGISSAAIKRQADIAKRHRWVIAVPHRARGEALRLTTAGEAALQKCLLALEQHTLGIFKQHNRSTNLMMHINTLLASVQEAQTAMTAIRSETSKRNKENIHANS